MHKRACFSEAPKTHQLALLRGVLGLRVSFISMLQWDQHTGTVAAK
jgi:hypothetical protein